MTDAALLALILAFFALARGYVSACDRLTGADGRAQLAGAERGSQARDSTTWSPADVRGPRLGVRDLLLAPPARRRCHSCGTPGQHLFRRCKACGHRYWPKDRVPPPPFDPFA